MEIPLFDFTWTRRELKCGVRHRLLIRSVYDVTCNNCQKPGHYAVNCDNRRLCCKRCTKTGHWSTCCQFPCRCNVCEGVGHQQPDCESVRNGLLKADVPWRCHNCEYWGHIRNDCPCLSPTPSSTNTNKPVIIIMKPNETCACCGGYGHFTRCTTDPEFTRRMPRVPGVDVNADSLNPLLANYLMWSYKASIDESGKELVISAPIVGDINNLFRAIRFGRHPPKHQFNPAALRLWHFGYVTRDAIFVQSNINEHHPHWHDDVPSINVPSFPSTTVPIARTQFDSQSLWYENNYWGGTIDKKRANKIVVAKTMNEGGNAAYAVLEQPKQVGDISVAYARWLKPKFANRELERVCCDKPDQSVLHQNLHRWHREVQAQAYRGTQQPQQRMMSPQLLSDNVDQSNCNQSTRHQNLHRWHQQQQAEALGTTPTSATPQNLHRWHQQHQAQSLESTNFSPQIPGTQQLATLNTERKITKQQQPSSEQLAPIVERTKHQPNVKPIRKKYSGYSDQLEFVGLRLRPIEADGNCLFRAFGDQFDGHDGNHMKHRRDVVNYIRLHKAEFEQFRDPETARYGTYDQYLCKLAMDGTYAGEDAIVAFMRLHNVNIVIHQLNTPDCEFRETSNNKRAIRLWFESAQEHYSSVRQQTDFSLEPTNFLLADTANVTGAEYSCGLQNNKDFGSVDIYKDLCDVMSIASSEELCGNTIYVSSCSDSSTNESESSFNGSLTEIQMKYINKKVNMWRRNCHSQPFIPSLDRQCRKLKEESIGRGKKIQLPFER